MGSESRQKTDLRCLWSFEDFEVWDSAEVFGVSRQSSVAVCERCCGYECVSEFNGFSPRL